MIDIGGFSPSRGILDSLEDVLPSPGPFRATKSDYVVGALKEPYLGVLDVPFG